MPQATPRTAWPQAPPARTAGRSWFLQKRPSRRESHERRTFALHRCACSCPNHTACLFQCVLKRKVRYRPGSHIIHDRPLSTETSERLLRVAHQVRRAVRIALARLRALVVRRAAEVSRPNFLTVYRLVAHHADDAVGTRHPTTAQKQHQQSKHYTSVP